MNALRAALSKEWTGFWLPRGQISPRHPADGVFFRLSQLSVVPPIRFWIGAKSYEVGIEEELFGIDFGTDTKLGDPTYESRWNPKRAPLTSSPQDLPLFELNPAPRAAMILTYARTLHEPQIAGDVLLDRALLVTANSGRRFLFMADEAIPSNLLCTCDGATIRRELSASHSAVSIGS